MLSDIPGGSSGVVTESQEFLGIADDLEGVFQVAAFKRGQVFRAYVVVGLSPLFNGQGLVADAYDGDEFQGVSQVAGIVFQQQLGFGDVF
jgi:hypothetical protein